MNPQARPNAKTSAQRRAGGARGRRLVVVDNRELCGACGQHRAQQIGLCQLCLAAHLDLTAYDASVERIREAGRS